MDNQFSLTEADLEDFYSLYQYAFNEHDSTHRRNFFMERAKHGVLYGMHDRGRLVSALYSLPFNVNFHGTIYTMNGIGDVMSAPEYSGRGAAGQLLKTALQAMYSSGVTLSYLAPFSFDYYRRFGYEQVFNKIVYTFKSEEAPRVKVNDTTGAVLRVSFEDRRDEILDFYARQPAAQAGGLIRPAWWWHYLELRNGWDAAIYHDKGGHIQGYVLYERDSEMMTVHEWMSATPAAFSELSRFIFMHRNSFGQISIEQTGTHYDGDLLSDGYGVHVEIEAYMMARVVNLVAFMQQYPYVHSIEPVIIAVSDPVIDANNGNWRLSVTDGQVSFTPVALGNNKDADLSLSIQQLVKVMFGERSLTSLLHFDQLQGNLSAVENIDRGLVHSEPRFYDYF
ncbi:MAG: GNAT family N-acetyltransferase [Schleiferilactobacillus harbinensis]|jgi:predicted acetyltransferase|nr:GNAT family N-acetyltransferase [Schleiferilactobacillus harbinensis]MCI1912148.1 GNAT family N-acetyltransferase [Schleiferilactobacillus harbinensis]